MTSILGIPVPSRDPVFLAIVVVHVLFGLASVVSGALAMLSRKGRGRHSKLGTAYFWCLFAVFLSMSALSALRWDENRHLFVLGLAAFLSACLGRIALRRRWRGWIRFHVLGMGSSYILLLTAFYVDNGKSLPIWNLLPQIAFWFVPAIFGVPLLVWTLSRHPLVRSLDRTGRGPESLP